MEERAHRPGEARRLLPSPDLLPGGAWRIAADLPSDRSAASLEPLLDGFPDADIIDVQDRDYERRAAGTAHAIGARFRDASAATKGFEILADPAFTTSFAGGVVDAAADGTTSGHALLGPVLTAATQTDGHCRGAHRRVAIAAATDDQALQIYLDLLVIVCDSALLVVWITDPLDGIPADTLTPARDALCEFVSAMS